MAQACSFKVMIPVSHILILQSQELVFLQLRESLDAAWGLHWFWLTSMLTYMAYLRWAEKSSVCLCPNTVMCVPSPLAFVGVLLFYCIFKSTGAIFCVGMNCCGSTQERCNPQRVNVSSWSWFTRKQLNFLACKMVD